MAVLPKPAECYGCPLFDLDPNGFSQPDGLGTTGVLVVGEALGLNERRDGLPFRPYAEAGSVLERAFRRAGFGRDHFRLWNVVACQPPGNQLEGESYEEEAIWHCRVHFRRVVEEFKPKAILALGNVALKALTGMSGPDRKVSDLRGYVLPSEFGPIIPTFHPSYLRRGSRRKDAETGAKTPSAAGGGGMSLLGVMIRDLQFAVQVAAGTAADYILHPEGSTYFTNCVERPSLDDARSFLREVEAAPETPLAFDLEHPRATETPDDDTVVQSVLTEDVIYSIQFSLRPCTGIYLPWSGEYIEIARRILALPNPKYTWFGRRNDNPRLRVQGFDIVGRSDDLWEAFHHLQPDIPARLQFAASFYGFPFPWKHWRGSYPERYGICDVDVLHWIARRIFDDLRRRGLYAAYERHIVGLAPELDRMSVRGIPVSIERHTIFAGEIDERQAVVRAEITACAPDECRHVHKPEGYDRPPAIVRQAVIANPAVERIESPAGVVYKLRNFPRPATNMDLLADLGNRRRWVRLEPFNPESWQQVLAYISHRGHPTPRMRDGTVTTAKTELERLARKTSDPFYGLILEDREFGTMKGTFLEGWRPGRDGRVHSTFYFAPGTGQFSSRDPNVQNAPHHTRLASSFRRIIEARPGYILLEFDYKSFHALTLGFEAQDADYMRLARLDIHSFLTAHLIGQPVALDLGDDDLGDRLEWIRSCGGDCRHSNAEKHEGRCWGFIRDYRAKRAVLGYGFGMGARKLYDMNRESFSSPKEAKATIDMLDGLFPRTAAWRDQIRRVAHRQGYLTSRFGYIRWFWDVIHHEPASGRTEFGDDSEAAIAFLPANDAFGIKKDAMLKLAAEGWTERASLINDVHDSLVFECLAPLAEEAASTIKAAMEAPNPTLIDPVIAPGGLWCAVGVKTGSNWAEMSAVR